jgi:predicted PhzF superfamily epimerase YddE/YHI9
MGIDEDPVTGSAHAVLAPFWAQRLGGKGGAAGSEALFARQCSPRGGEMRVRCVGDKVQVEGCAVVVLSGTLRHQH